MLANLYRINCDERTHSLVWTWRKSTRNGVPFCVTWNARSYAMSWRVYNNISLMHWCARIRRSIDCCMNWTSRRSCMQRWCIRIWRTSNDWLVSHNCERMSFSIDGHLLFSVALHADRVCFWRSQYEHEKRILLQQYTDEMDQYKDRKFKAHKELECVYYGLENIADRFRDEAETNHQTKIDNIKSKVWIIFITISCQ